MNSRPDDRWVCPNDRVLSFRSKLDAGWSVRSTCTGSSLQPSYTPSISTSSSNLSITPSPSCADISSGFGGQVTSSITEEEQAKILSVISRAKRVEQMEKDRIQRLTDRLQNMARNSGGNGRDHCALCNEKLRFFSLKASSFDCQQCEKLVCNKCVVDEINPETNTTSFFCKLCCESRELVKKSGAWFLKALPTFPLIESAPSNRPSSSFSPSSSSTASFSGHQLNYYLRSHSPPSPTSTLNSFDSSLTLNAGGRTESPRAAAAGSPTSARPQPVTRTCQPPHSLPSSPSTRHRFSMYFGHRSRMK